MSNENNIDKLFREGLKENTHAFNEGAWEKMDALLNEQSTFSWLSFAKIASVFISISLILTSSNFSSKNLIADSNESKPSNFLAQGNTVAPIPSSKETRSTELHVENESTHFAQENAESSIPSTEKDLASRGSSSDHIISETKSQKSDRLKESPVASRSTPDQYANKSENTESLAEASIYTSDQPSATHNLQLLPKRDLNIDLSEEVYFDPVEKTSLPKPKKHLVSIYAGLNIDNGLTQQVNLSGVNALQIIGFNYHFMMNKNWSLVSGLSYRSKDGQGAQLTFNEVQYGFGKTTKTTTINAKSLHYLEMPLEVRYNIKGKHTILAGVSVSHLLNVKSEVEQQNEESLQQNSSSNKLTTWGYKEGINQWDMGVRLGYNYEFTPKLSAGAMINYGALDITNDDIYKSASKHTNLDLRVLVQYKLFRF